MLGCCDANKCCGNVSIVTWLLDRLTQGGIVQNCFRSCRRLSVLTSAARAQSKEVAMSLPAEQSLKNVLRTVNRDPGTARREKLIARIEGQLQIVAAVWCRERYAVAVMRKVTNDASECVKQAAEERAQAWYHEQDRGLYVQCSFGAAFCP